MSTHRRDLWRVLAGTSAAQAIPVVASLVLARQYSPAAFGGFATWLAASTFASVLVGFRLDGALGTVSPGEDRLRLISGTVTVILWGASLVCAAGVLAYLTGLTAQLLPGVAVGLVGIGAATICLTQLWLSYAAVEGLLDILATLRIRHAISVATAQILAGTLSPSATSLTVGYISGGLISTWLAYRTLRKRHGLSLSLWSPGALETLSRHWRFPIVATPAALVGSASEQSPLIIAAARFGDAAAGAYAIALRTLGTPLTVLANSALDIFKRQASSAYQERGECTKEFLSAARQLGIVALCFLGLALLTIKPLMAIAFGAKWSLAAEVAYLLVPLYAARLAVSPLSFVLYLAHKQHIDLAWQLLLLGTVVSCFSAGASFLTSVRLFAFAYIALYAAYFIVSYRASKGANQVRGNASSTSPN